MTASVPDPFYTPNQGSACRNLCNEGEVCVEVTGQCIPGCVSDSECEEGEVCDPILGYCVLGEGCYDASDCRFGQSEAS